MLYGLADISMSLDQCLVALRVVLSKEVDAPEIV